MSEDLEYHGRSWTLPDAIVDKLSEPTSGAGRIQRLVLGVLLAHRDDDELPTNGRFVFYELEGLGYVSKSSRGQSRRGGVDDPREQEVIDALMKLRSQEVIPWDWIADETRTLHQWRCSDTVTDCVTEAIVNARLNPWGTAPPLLLCESRSLAGVLTPLARQYRCAIAATNGQAGGFLRTDIAPFLAGNERPVLYLGDFDHQGFQIEDNTRHVLEQAAGRVLEWERIAITPEQIEDRGLEPRVKEDGRYKPPKVLEAWECEELGQSTVVALVQGAFDRLLVEPLADVLEREEQERDVWVARLQELER